MTTPAERLSNWIDEQGKRFSSRVGSWLGTAIGAGIDAFMKMLGKSFAPKLKPLMDKIEANTDIPPELKLLWDEMKSPTGEAAAILATRLANGIISSGLSSILDYITRPILQSMSFVPGFTLFKPEVLISGYLRHLIDKPVLYTLMRFHGIAPPEVDALLTLSELRFPSDIAGEAALRDEAKYGKYWDDVRSLGVTEDRIEVLKELAYKLPTAQEAITWLAREVFEPQMVEKYGLDDEFIGLDLTILRQIGIKDDIALKHWRAHWQHASYSQVLTMLHRGLLTEQDVYDWFRLVEIPPFWRDNLTKTMYNLPGRIETRMMAQYGLVDKAFIVDILRKDGLDEEYLDVVADMNLVRGIRTDIQSRYTKGWLDSEGVRAEIEKSGLSPEIGNRLYQWIVSNTKPERTQAQKDLTKTEIVKAVKVGELVWSDGVDLITKMGYDEDEANIILAIGIPVAAEELTDIQKIQIDTTRRQRRKQLIAQEDEVRALIAIGISPELAQAYADNDEVRLGKAPEEETP